MPLLGQDENLTWWRPLIIPFRPLVIIFNMLLKSRGGRLLPPSRQSPQLVSTNEERWKVVRDESGRISEIVVHRQVESV